MDILHSFLRENYITFGNKEVDIEVNIAVLGDSGSGKSAFINVIRDLRYDDDKAAPINQIYEIRRVKLYPHPKNEKLKFWEIPEIGTRYMYFPNETFLKDINFKRYDVFIIATCSKFSERNIMLAKDLEMQGKQIHFIRTKFEFDLGVHTSGVRKMRQDSSVVNELKTLVYNNIRDCMSDLRSKDNIFLIDNYQADKFDFSRLKNSLRCVIIEILERRLNVNRFFISRAEHCKVMNEIEFYRKWCSFEPKSQNLGLDIPCRTQLKNVSPSVSKKEGDEELSNPENLLTSCSSKNVKDEGLSASHIRLTPFCSKTEEDGELSKLQISLNSSLLKIEEDGELSNPHISLSPSMSKKEEDGEYSNPQIRLNQSLPKIEEDGELSSQYIYLTRSSSETDGYVELYNPLLLSPLKTKADGGLSNPHTPITSSPSVFEEHGVVPKLNICSTPSSSKTETDEDLSNPRIRLTEKDTGHEQYTVADKTLVSLNHRSAEHNKYLMPQKDTTEHNSIEQRNEFAPTRECSSTDEIAALISFLPPLGIHLI